MSKNDEFRQKPSGIGKQPWEPMKVTFIGHVGELIRDPVPPSQVPGKKVPPPDSDAFMRRSI